MCLDEESLERTQVIQLSPEDLSSAQVVMPSAGIPSEKSETTEPKKKARRCTDSGYYSPNVQLLAVVMLPIIKYGRKRWRA